MKVLMIAPYRDGTGYGHAAIDNILAMDAAGIDIVPRPIKLNNHTANIPDRIVQLENKSTKGCSIVIQHTLPSMMEYSGHFKANIAMYCSETSNFRASRWPERLNAMDVAWVPSTQMHDAARDSKVTIPIVKLPYPADMSKFERSYKPLKLPIDGFTFYTIAEMGKRKNLLAILQAFHSEFKPGEPVSLVIKTHRYGVSPQECRKHIEADCDTVKQWLRLHRKLEFYKKEIIITDFLTDDSVMRLHSTCDCFVLVSHGEAWSIPAFEAMALGKTPIVTNWGGFKEYMTQDTGWLVDCKEEQVFGITDNLPDLYTGRENWAIADVGHLRKCMREAYSNKQLRSRKAEVGIERAYDFGYNIVGPLIKKELESYEQEKWQTTLRRKQ